MSYTQFTEDVFVVDCWPDNKDKENVLVELLTRLRVYNSPIILCGHYPVNPEIQKLADYYLYDSNNDLLLEKDFDKYGVNSDRWTDFGNVKLTNKIEFHHDYAIWLTMKNAFALAKQLGKKYIHFLEYDNLPDEIQYRQAFMEYVRNNDVVVQEYSEGSTKEDNPYCATYIFSIKTDVALEMVSKINSKEEFFKNKPNRWQLEKVFYQTLKSMGSNIFVSKYIPNDNELNIFAAWNRNGITKNGARVQTYLGGENNQLYIHFVSGFSERPADKDYLLEINYDGYKQFMTLKKGEYRLERLGRYVQGKEVTVYYQGVEIFNEFLKDNFEEFRRKNKVTFTNQVSDRQVNIHNIDGPFVEIKESNDLMYHVQFVNTLNNKVLYELNLKSNHWAKCGIKYYVDWKIIIKGIDNDFYLEHLINPKGNKVLISFESKSLGDTLAFMPYVDKFKTEKGAQVVCSTFHNHLFKSQYPDIQFVEPGTSVNGVSALYRLGLFYKGDGLNRKIDMSCHPTDPKKEPLLKVASDILGLDYEERKPKLKKISKKKQKRVCIAIHSTSQAKYWNNPTGWQEVVDYLIDKGYEVRLISAEENGYMGNFQPKGVVRNPKGTLNDLIELLQESEFFIGISSGLSWLSWACNIPTVIISGFTDIDLEPLEGGVIRVINKNVCHGCWSKHEFDAGDWNWCPEHKGTDRQFECSKEISGETVIKKINSLIF